MHGLPAVDCWSGSPGHTVDFAEAAEVGYSMIEAYSVHSSSLLVVQMLVLQSLE